MHEYHLLEILAVGFALALLLGYVAHRLGLSPIVGYLLAGFLLGPQTPGFAADIGLAQELAEAGVILLMFGVGLHFDLKDLFAVKGVAVPGAIVQSTVATICGTAVTHMLGLPWSSGLILGMGLAVASTVVLLRVLEDNNMLDTVHGHVAVGWLVVEDLITVFVLVLLPSIALIFTSTATLSTTELLWAFAEAVIRITLLWIIVLLIGGKVVPWLLTKVVRTRSQELFTLTVLVAAFATAVASAKFFQASMALGAFLGGMVIGRTTVSYQAGADLLPLRDAFAVLFFLSVGMLLDPGFIVQQPWLIILCLAIILIFKPLAALLVVAILGYSGTTALVVSISLAQIGEFSFIMAQQANALGLIPNDIYNVLVVCAIISICINPSLFRLIPGITKFMQGRPWLWKILNARADHKAAKQRDKFLDNAQDYSQDSTLEGLPLAVVVGYGPTGRNVVEALLAKNLTPIIIDLNADTVNNLNDNNKRAVFGDSTKRDVLRAANINKADYLIITVPNLDQVTITAGTAKELNPNVRVLARARFLKNKRLLEQVGVDGIAFEEKEVAKALTNLFLEDLERCGRGQCLIDAAARAEAAKIKK